MFFLEGDTTRPVFSASDITVAAQSEFGFLRRIDEKLERLPKLLEEEDLLLARTAELGNLHEEQVLESFRQQFGAGVVEIQRPARLDEASLRAAAARTEEALRAQAPVVFQATLFDGQFVGFADFLVLLPSGSYQVLDTKLARSAKITALLQLAAYAEQLRKLGIAVSDEVVLILGDGTRSLHQLQDILPVFRVQRDRLVQLIRERLADTEPVRWGDARYTISKDCAHSAAEIQRNRDLLLVAGLTMVQRQRLNAHGVFSIDQLGNLPPHEQVAGIPGGTLQKLVAQAALQLETEQNSKADTGAKPVYRVVSKETLRLLPRPNPGDLFFDFEGDPLYTEEPQEGSVEPKRWGLDYLFGVAELGVNLAVKPTTADPAFTAFIANNFAEERKAFLAFLDFVERRRIHYPNLRVYHYASYERTHLLQMTGRYGVGAEIVDNWVREGLLVDLLPIVRGALRVGAASYSLKDIEKIYMGDELREAEVTTAGDSIVQFARVQQFREGGKLAEAEQVFEEILDYNRYDCLSTQRLRDWLLRLAEQEGVEPGTAQDERSDFSQEGKDQELSNAPTKQQLRAQALAEQQQQLRGEFEVFFALDHPELSAEQRKAAALAAASLDFFERERKSFWWEHFFRLNNPTSDWENSSEVFLIDEVSVSEDWEKPTPRSLHRRTLRASGEWLGGVALEAGTKLQAIYRNPKPFETGSVGDFYTARKSTELIGIDDQGRVLIKEALQKVDTDFWHETPIALVPATPINTQVIEEAIARWLAEILPALSEGRAIHDPMFDLLLRSAPRLSHGGSLPSVREGNTIEAVLDALLSLDHSYLAVQGPPGTGKTYLASRVITELVQRHGWKVGVVAQSHKAVENVLTGLIAAGLPIEKIGKRLKAGQEPSAELPYTPLGSESVAGFVQSGGVVLGGTAWDFCNLDRVQAKELDLLVIDEAGQYSLAYSIGVSTAAKNMLLLGDPQQLPQVSQGVHPEPVDQAALAWLSGEAEALDPQYGYFLAETRRLSAELTEPVSELSYGGKLKSLLEVTRGRSLAGVPAGLFPTPVAHEGNQNSSPEEALKVVELIRDLMGAPWSDQSENRENSPLDQEDFIVVTPYNAQRVLLREQLEAAGFDRVPVGTVDKFQGQEAVIAIVSLAASSATEVPRGLSFLTMKNRLNVAISRAKWAAYLVYSPELTQHLPTSPETLAEHSAFVNLVLPDTASGSSE